MGNYKFIEKPGEYDIFTPFIGKGIPVATGEFQVTLRLVGLSYHSMFVFTDERWKKNRRLLNPAFHFQILNPFVDAINNKGINCIEKFEEALENHKGGEMDVFPIIISRSTLDIICGNYLSSV